MKQLNALIIRYINKNKKKYWYDVTIRISENDVDEIKVRNIIGLIEQSDILNPRKIKKMILKKEDEQLIQNLISGAKTYVQVNAYLGYFKGDR